MSVVKQIVVGQATHDGAGVKINRVLGNRTLRHLDPFLMLDEFGSTDPGDYVSGFPMHPHRGFQTVTYMLKGKMRHRDSVGNIGEIKDGGLQWMNAGCGIIHEEMPLLADGQMRGFQFWINLPSAEKLSSPNYQDIASEHIPEVDFNAGHIRVLAGEYQGTIGAATTQVVKPELYDVHFNRDGEWSTKLPNDYNALLYCYDGELVVSDEGATTTIDNGQLAVLDCAYHFRIRGNSGSNCILLASAPINEPIVQYGPFVMNTEDEIKQAIRDYQMNKLV